MYVKPVTASINANYKLELFTKTHIEQAQKFLNTAKVSKQTCCPRKAELPPAGTSTRDAALSQCTNVPINVSGFANKLLGVGTIT